MWRGPSRCRSPKKDTKYCQALPTLRVGTVGEEKGVKEQVCTLPVLGWENSVVGGREVDQEMGVRVQRIYGLETLLDWDFIIWECEMGIGGLSMIVERPLVRFGAYL